MLLKQNMAAAAKKSRFLQKSHGQINPSMPNRYRHFSQPKKGVDSTPPPIVAICLIFCGILYIT